MDTMPTDRRIDSAPALLADGYEFISRRCARLDSDVFATRLLFEPTVCVRGHEAARMFYDVDRFTRVGAAPGRLSRTLFGEGGVQQLDGTEHRARKAMFMSLMTPDRIADLVALADEQWRRAARRWRTWDRIVLFDEVTLILARAVFAWAGVPLADHEVAGRGADLAAMIDAPGAIGPRYVRGRLGRVRGDRWAERVIRRVRAGSLPVADDSPVAVIAAHRGPDGDALDVHSAAVELLNVLRPTVAVARYVVFVAMALQRHPRARARADDDRYVEWFVQEVRRDYPFFPFVAARVREDFVWHGHRFPQGVRALLDLYGTNHHGDLWEHPHRFLPGRFADRDPGAFDLIPQGGGDHLTNHRCAGEWITIALMRHAMRFLTQGIRYDVPAQDLTVRLSRMPAVPQSRFVITAVEPSDEAPVTGS